VSDLLSLQEMKLSRDYVSYIITRIRSNSGHR